MDAHHYFVLHSPYRDGTWRGAEKCLTTDEGAPRLFNTPEEGYALLDPDLHEFYVPVPVVLVTPEVGHHFKKRTN